MALYDFLKIPARLTFWIYCRNLKVNNPEILKTKGPLLIACNHPNSFLDAIVLSSIFRQPIFSLTRGDVFQKPLYKKLLHSLNMLPVYRTSEGVHNLEHNYTTFDSCKNIFTKNGIVLIFSEGRCINEWHLRPLMKGTARLAISSWQNGIDLKVLPTGLNYDSFRNFGKNIQLNFGEVISAKNAGYNCSQTDGKNISNFNTLLLKELEKCVIEIAKDDEGKRAEIFIFNQSILKKVLLFFPAILGILFHFPLYFLVEKIGWKFFSNNDHFDSVEVGLLFILYPFYLILFFFIFYQFIGAYSFLVFLIFPFFAYSYVQLKKQ